MLSVYFGTDTNRVRAAAFAAATADGVTPTTLTGETYEPGALADIVAARSLFTEMQVILIDTPREMLAEELSALLPAMANGSDRYIVIEGPLLTAAKKKYAEHTDALHEYTAPKTERFNTFTLADALARKDKRGLWVSLQQARRAGISAEEITGVLWWQLKNIRLAALTSTAAEAGMKEYPYRKAKAALRTIPEADAARLARSLLRLYHEGHGGEVDLDLAIEQWVLSL